MLRTKRGSAFWVLAALVALHGCSERSSPTDDAARQSAADSPGLLVYSVNYPLHYFAQRIGGELVRAEFPVPADVDPAFWRPGVADVGAYQQADLVLLNGAGYAKWLASVSLASSKLVQTSAAFQDRYITVDEVESHAHGPEGEHEHRGVAFTTWLDFRLAQAQARAIEAAFREALPEGAESFRAGFTALERDLQELDARLRELVRGQQPPLLGSHPVYQYFARGYGLALRSVHFEPDELPSTEAWGDLEASLEEYPARWMVWEGPPLESTAARLKGLGVESVVFDPCGNRPEAGDFLTVQRANVENLRRIYAPES